METFRQVDAGDSLRLTRELLSILARRDLSKPNLDADALLRSAGNQFGVYRRSIQDACDGLGVEQVRKFLRSCDFGPRQSSSCCSRSIFEHSA